MRTARSYEGHVTGHVTGDETNHVTHTNNALRTLLCIAYVHCTCTCTCTGRGQKVYKYRNKINREPQVPELQTAPGLHVHVDG